MITPSFNLTATERVLPKLALDFTTANLDSRVTFTRTTDATHPATYVNSSGYVTSATDNQPRFDYNPINLTCNGLLIEESRTNLVKYSNDFSNVLWIKSALVESSEATISPDGTTNGWKLIPNSTTATHSFDYNSALTNGSYYTLSIFAKESEYKSILLTFGLSRAYVSFNLVAGTASSVYTNGTDASNGSAKITNFGNGWYRCSFTVQIVNGSFGYVRMAVLKNATDTWNERSYTGDGTSGIYIWGAQLEAGAFATSYIPTTLIPLTRNADVATMTGTNFSDWYNASEGTLFGQGIRQYTNESAIFTLTDGTNLIELFGRSGNSNAGFYVSNSTTQANIDISNGFPINTVVKVAGAYKTNDINAAANSVLGTKDTLASLPTATSARIGSYSTTAGFFRGWIQKLSYYNIRLTDAELQAITK